MTFFRSLRRLLALNRYLQVREQYNSSLTLAAQVPRAAGLKSDRIYSDRSVVPSLRRKA